MLNASLSTLFAPATRALTKVWTSPSHERIELRAIPPLLRPSDPAFVAEWDDGALALAGHSVRLAGRSPFDVTNVPTAWLAALYGFSWLRHIPTDPDVATTELVHDVVSDWIARRRRAVSVGMHPAVTARRVLSWLAHADLLLQTSDAAFYDAVMASLTADLRALEQSSRSVLPVADRLLVWVAMAQAGICLSHAEPMRSAAEAGLAEMHARSKCADILRQPEQLADFILDIETLRLLYGMRSMAVPTSVAGLKNLMAAGLGGLLLGDRRPARLASPRIDGEAGHVLAAVLRHADISPPGPCHDEHAGFVRLVLGDTRVVADVGAPLQCASALALEISSGSAPMLTSDGQAPRTDVPTSGTIYISPRLPSDGAPQRISPDLEPTQSVALDCVDLDNQRCDATHAGLARHGFVHRRRLTLSDRGCRFDVIDELRPLLGCGDAADPAFAVRLVLHPSVKVVLQSAGDQLELTLTNGHCWRLAAPGRKLSVEGAVFRDGRHATPTLQILILADTSAGRIVAWQLTRPDPRS